MTDSCETVHKTQIAYPRFLLLFAKYIIDSRYDLTITTWLKQDRGPKVQGSEIIYHILTKQNYTPFP